MNEHVNAPSNKIFLHHIFFPNSTLALYAVKFSSRGLLSIHAYFIQLHSTQSTKMIKLKVNRKEYNVDVSPEMPLLWVLRDVLGLTGTKYGCGTSQCGACTVHLDGTPIRSCSFPVSAATGIEITTIEGISENIDHAVQKAWIEIQVPQCGYCQSGQIMSAVALLKRIPKPTDADIDAAMQGNLCRCGTYQRIRKAIHRAAELAQV
jgi:isoquinoline 1-oxidoreductase subunit alpha